MLECIVKILKKYFILISYNQLQKSFLERIVMNNLDDLIKENNRLKLKAEGLKLEYEYVNELKDERIKEIKSNMELEREKFEFEKKELLNEIKILQDTKESLKKEIIDLKNIYENSISWKITKPFRIIKKAVKGVR